MIDPIIRGRMGMDINNAVIVFDEAHNLEDISRTAASFEVSLDDLNETSNGITKVLQILKDDVIAYESIRSVVCGLASWVQLSFDSLTPSDYSSNKFVFNGKSVYDVSAFHIVSTNTY